ncbi:glycosyltransferase family 2 protein [Thalassospira sp. HF15]|uniref:glycosyltransferase family 2 protein n=1 Tax=Thalassospira sp. HF15 TaxID=2722755 RepID=UPI0014311A5D|nr:glycosyltransferase family A protein [Thalassospira sp. HF15]NIY75442.1 glycosyltransferase family 2 protein [Thalassospira sp. HF15]
MTGEATVSVIIPCYNGHAYLDQAIQSALNQTHPPIEVLIVDDGSDNPETIAHLDGIALDVRVIRQKNKGLPGARNTGFREAKGEYVLPLDCDDWLDPEFIEKTLHIIENNENIDFAFSWLSLEAESQGVLPKHYNFFEQLFLNQLPYCLLQPKRLWQEVGGYDENMKHGYEDWEWNIRLGKSGYFGGAVFEPLFHYRVQSNAMLASISRQKHVDLWMFIRQKHPELYSLRSLKRTWLQWRSAKSTRSLWLYFGWEALYRVFPQQIFRKVVSVLFAKSHSSKFKKVELEH